MGIWANIQMETDDHKEMNDYTYIFYMRSYNQSHIIKKGQILTNLTISENFAYFADNAYDINKHSFE